MSRKVLMVVFSAIIVLLVVVLAVGISGASVRAPWWSGARPADSLAASFEFASADVSRVALRLAADDVDVVPGSEGVIRLEQWTADSGPQPEPLACTLADGTLLAGTDARPVRWWPFFGPDPVSCVTVQVPPAAVPALSAAVKSGDVSIRELRFGQLEIDSGAGNVELRGGAAEHAAVHTAGGNIDIEDFSPAELDCRTGAGDICLNQIAAGRTAAETSGGDIDIRDVSLRELECRAAAGNVAVAGATVVQGAYLDASAGDVEFGGSCAVLQAEAAAGNVTADVADCAGVAASSACGDVELQCRSVQKLAGVRAETRAGNVTVQLPAGTRISLAYEPGLGGMHFEDGADLNVDGGGIPLEISCAAGDLFLGSF